MEKKILITVKETYLDKMEDILESLAKHKMKITDSHQFGVISGSVEEENISQIKSEPYIDAVEDDEIAGVMK